ncbi:MAG: tRNA pseudouridine(55) synthase TruB [Candidatus Omnitrophica bacterium]|nr:tRNA pseudouridine(55) synthase TruB [Candidatus Omnitrophota bacterium]MDD5310303.1 tRNA pseudouridine(55) synthase TruB [Candidatus Omnitrophota bacterium]MDD5545848.1 tRNA pseudouridine(55) synthase TruB [Candidatus Omnitrophota bacterium]
MSDPDGILLVDKPAGMTSHDMIDLIRRNFGIKKAGHAGTLDPAATGLLVILTGKATKLSSKFMSGDKEYEAIMTLGRKTDSGDAEGKVLAETGYAHITAEKIRDVFKGFEGETGQVPPMFSAIQIKGKRLYQLARRGVEVPREPRNINIKELRISGIELPLVHFTVRCSKGTYIRKLCDDIGDRLGCGGYLSGLRRTASGEFALKDSIDITGLKSISRSGLEERLVKI